MSAAMKARTRLGDCVRCGLGLYSEAAVARRMGKMCYEFAAEEGALDENGEYIEGFYQNG